jgi:hypothetical protein
MSPLNDRRSGFGTRLDVPTQGLQCAVVHGLLQHQQIAAAERRGQR